MRLGKRIHTWSDFEKHLKERTLVMSKITPVLLDKAISYISSLLTEQRKNITFKPCGRSVIWF
jgi:hypothetical protein